MIGNEGKGISRLAREHCDLLIRIPMRGHIGSLNAAVAGSVALYEIWRQRGWQTNESNEANMATATGDAGDADGEIIEAIEIDDMEDAGE